MTRYDERRSHEHEDNLAMCEWSRRPKESRRDAVVGSLCAIASLLIVVAVFCFVWVYAEAR